MSGEAASRGDMSKTLIGYADRAFAVSDVASLESLRPRGAQAQAREI